MITRLNKQSIAAIVLCTLLIVFSSSCVSAALSGFDMWLIYVMPSIFPFFVGMGLLRESGFLKGGAGIFSLFISCCLAAAPSGSRLCSELVNTGRLKSEDLSQFAAYCNMASPAFLTGTLGLMAGTQYLIPVIIGHYLSSLILLLLNSKKLIKQNAIPNQSQKPFFSVLCRSIEEGVIASIKICGVIIFFTVILQLIVSIGKALGIKTGSLPFVMLVSLIEMTNGCSLISSLPLAYGIKCSLLALIVGFGGICIMGQSATFCKLDTKKYVTHKLFQGMLSGMLAFIASALMPRTATVFSDAGQVAGELITGTVSLAVIALSSLFACAFIYICGKFKTKA